MVARQRGPGWQADFMVKGKRYRGQFESFDEADTWETEVRLALKKGAPLPEAPSSPAAPGNLDTLGALYTYTLEHEWKGMRAEEFLARNGRMVCERLGWDKRVAEVTSFDVDKLIKDLLDAGQSPASVNRKLASLSKMLYVAVTKHVIAHRPLWKRRREPEGRNRFLTESEEADILAGLWVDDETGVPYRDLTTFLIDTGLRVGEALSLEWQEVGVDRVTILAAKSKSKKMRQVPLTSRARGILDGLRGTPEGPFRKLRYHNYRNRFATVTRRLKLSDVVIHSLRHTTASRLVMAGVDIYRVSKFMGHSNVQVTQRYAHLAPDSLDGLAGALERTTKIKEVA